MLYICATPIGNLQDLSFRAVEILSLADIILCEDTRTSKFLLQHHHINYKRLVSFHEHNELNMLDKVLQWLEQGLNLVQISDAGTPAISDPGAKLCDYILAHGYQVSPIPGACAYSTLLSVAGLTTSSLFYGFLPSTTSKRKKILETWLYAPYAICIYEAPHRIIECLEDINTSLGGDTQIVMGRELTKKFETIRKSNAHELLDFIKNNQEQQRGEFVLFIIPSKLKEDIASLTPLQLKTLKLLLPELPPKKAVSLTHQLVGGDKTLLYNYAIS